MSKKLSDIRLVVFIALLLLVNLSGCEKDDGRFTSSEETYYNEERGETFITGRFELPAITDTRWFLEYFPVEFAMEYDITKKHSKWVAWRLHICRPRNQV